MGHIVAGMATSHAFTFVDPRGWDDFRARNRESLRRRTGQEPGPHAGVENETLAGNQERFARITDAHQRLREQLAEAKPTALIVIGDDQNENFTSTFPQIAVFVGKPGATLRTGGHFARGAREYPVHHALAQAICARGVQENFDIALVTEFVPEELKSHAHVQVIEALVETAEIPVVLVFVNAIHVPTLEPQRCHALGQMIARVIAEQPEHERVAICASGGLSHFTAGYPWKSYSGDFAYGDISEDFDRRAVALIERGEGAALANMTGADFLAHGNVEMRAWVALLGAMGNLVPRFVVYEPFYRALMGMSVASWGPAPAGSGAEEPVRRAPA